MKVRSIGYLAMALILGLGLGAYQSGSSELAAQSAGRLNVLVLCSSCLPPGGDINRDQDKVGQWLLDLNTGDIWLYHAAALRGSAKPIYLGKLARLGEPVQPK